MLRRVSSTSNNDEITYDKGTTIRKPLKKIYYLSFAENNVRDEIIRTVENNFRGENFITPLIAHLKKIGPDKFDAYSEIELAITEYNVFLTFKMKRGEEHAMSYTLPDLTLEPDARLAAPVRKRWFGLF
jgi:hypothetical protein